MIASLRGVAAERHADHVVVDVGGVGYRVFVSLTTLSDLPGNGEVVRLYIHTLVREDTFHLYGFSTEEERETFRALVKVKDVGPKVARTILGVPANQLAQAVAAGDVAWLKRLPGVGPRIAERLVVELRGKLGAAARSTPLPSPLLGPGEEGGVRQDLCRALASLGYRPAEVERVVKKLRPRIEGGASLEELIRDALEVAR